MSDQKKLLELLRDGVVLAEKIKESPEYVDMKNKLDDMEAPIRAANDAYNAVRDQIISDMKASGDTGLYGLKAKIRKNNAVNIPNLLNELNGDIGLFCEIAEVKQKGIKDFAKENERYKDLPKKCIEETGFTIVDIII